MLVLQQIFLVGVATAVVGNFVLTLGKVWSKYSVKRIGKVFMPK